MTKGESPENAGEEKRDRAGDQEMQHQPGWLAQGPDQQFSWDVRDDNDGNNPAEDELKQARKNRVGIAGDLEEIKVAVNQALGADDPEADRGQGEHDGVMNGDPETKRDQIKHDHRRAGHDLEFA